MTQIAANNFPLRAKRLATEVALTRPDVIGLQEVFDFTVDGFNVGPPFVNHLDTLLAELAARGQNYVVAATVEHLDITLPIPGVGNVRVLDRDVILVRSNVSFTNINGSYLIGGLCELPIPNPAFGLIGPANLTSSVSEDGCNYTITAGVNSPVGFIDIERGFVAIDATVRGKTYRVVNTHLEVQQPDPLDPNSAIIQFLQSVELVGSVQSLTASDVPIILLGDINSGPTDPPLGPIVPPYQVLAGSGFADSWDNNWLALFDPNGFTCCELSDLSNTSSIHDERIDVIFTANQSFIPLAWVIGRAPLFPLGLPPNWASDHGGVYGKLIARP